MSYTRKEILEVIRMTEIEHFDVRTVTMGISLLDCSDEEAEKCSQKIYDKIKKYASNLPNCVDEVAELLGIRVANKRIALTPLAIVGTKAESESYFKIAQKIDKAAMEIGIDYVGGFSALIEGGFTKQDLALMDSIPDVLSSTKTVCSSINAGSTRMGLNVDGVIKVASIIKKTAYLTRDKGSIGCSKFVVFANAVDNNPFIAGAFHGVCNPEVCINIGLSGPGVVLDAIKSAKNCDLRELSETIKRASYKVTRVGEILGREVSKRLNVPFGIVDISLAPTPELNDSVGEVLMAMGIERPGGVGTTAALALLTDAVKKGGAMATSQVGGLSGAFIPVSEDSAMISAVLDGHLSLEKLEAMTSVCSVGLDMVAVPGDTPEEVLAGLILDELMIGIINNKTTAVRIIPVYGKKAGEVVSFGGLLGDAPVQEIRRLSPKEFILRGGHIPPPIQSMKN